MLPSLVTAVPLRTRVEGLHLPTMPKAETALDRPEEPFWPILVRLPRSMRLSNSRTSCWLYTCYKQIHTEIYCINISGPLFICIITMLSILPCNTRQEKTAHDAFVSQKKSCLWGNNSALITLLNTSETCTIESFPMQ